MKLAKLVFFLSFIYSFHQIESLESNLFDNARLSGRYFIGEFITIKDAVEGEAFLPRYISNETVSFVDINAYKLLKQKNWGANIGVGFRTYSNFGVFGLNAFYDYAKIRSSVNSCRIGIGLELLNPCWDLRINGYLPAGKKTKPSKLCIFDHIGDNFFATKKKLEHVYEGIDAEIGFPVVNTCEFRLYGAIGPYYYSNRNLHRFGGVMARVELNLDPRISIHIRYSYDRVYSSKAQGILEISLPFEDLSCCFCQDPLTQPLRRNNIIQTDTCCDWKWNWDNQKKSKRNRS